MSTVIYVLMGLTVFFVLVIAGFLIFNGGTSANTGTVKGLLSKWWAGLDSESSPGQRFVLLCGALLLAYGELRWRGSVWAALILLLFAALIKPPKSKITLAFVWLDLSLVILAGFFSGVLGMRSSTADIVDTWFTKKSVAMAQYAKDYKEGKLPQEPDLSATTQAKQAIPSTQQLEQTMTLSPGGDFQKAEVPLGKVIEKIEWSCSNGCVTEIVHEGGQLCHNGVYKDLLCDFEIVGYTSHNIPIYREQFEEPKGVFVTYPRNLIHVIYSFATMDGAEETEVKVTTVISG